ncbi:MAG: integrase core domain-containing protein [Bacillota bacterium]
MSNHFLGEIRWLGIESSPAFVGEPEGNGVAEWFIRQFKEQVLWSRRFRMLKEVRQAVVESVDRFNRE